MIIKRTQLNIEISEGLLKSLKLLAIKKNVKLNALVKDILSEKINTKLKNNIEDALKEEAKMNEYKTELNKLRERVSNIERAQNM